MERIGKVAKRRSYPFRWNGDVHMQTNYELVHVRDMKPESF